MKMSVFSVKSLFSATIRKKCMTKFNSVNIPAIKHVVPKAKAAAVLVPICGVDGEACLFYTVRSHELRDSAGQVAFPGGHRDGNETPEETALRETNEEIGLDKRLIEVWGVGPPVPGRNNKHVIVPVVGSIQDCHPETFKLNSKEVSEAFTVPIELLCDPKNQFYTQFKNGFVLPVFVAERYKIWGITAFITHVLLSSLLPKEIYHNEWMKKKIVITN